MPQNYISQIKKILEYFSQNKKNKLTEKNFLVPSARKFDLNKEDVSKLDKFLDIQKTFLTKKIFLISRKLFLFLRPFS